jgi:hypothetical protein
MCQAAADFVGVGNVECLVSDPSDLKPGDVYSFTPGVDPRVGLGANVMFLHNIASVAGPQSDILARNRIGEPGDVALALELVEKRLWIDVDGLAVDAALAGIWIAGIWMELSHLAR